MFDTITIIGLGHIGLPTVALLASRKKKVLGVDIVIEPNLQALPEILTDAQVALMDLDEAITWAHILVLLVDHAQFKCIKPKLASHQSLVDTRGIWSETK